MATESQGQRVQTGEREIETERQTEGDIIPKRRKERQITETARGTKRDRAGSSRRRQRSRKANRQSIHGQQEVS